MRYWTCYVWSYIYTKRCSTCSFLGPVLFTVYIHVDSFLTGRCIRLYADDTIMYHTPDTVRLAVSFIQLCFADFQDTFNYHSIFHNADQTKFKLFSTSKLLYHDNLVTATENIIFERITVYNCLGIWIHDKLLTPGCYGCLSVCTKM